MARSSTTFDLRARTAHHEAGHAVLSVAINDHPEHVSIRGHGETLGRSAQKMLGRPTSLAQVYLAGFAAEHLLTGRRPQAFGVEVGLGVLAHLDPKLVDTIEGVDAADGYGAVHQVLRSGVREVEDEIRTEVERLYGVARESLRAVWPSVRTVAEALNREPAILVDYKEAAYLLSLCKRKAGDTSLEQAETRGVNALKQRVASGRIPARCIKRSGRRVQFVRVALVEWVSGRGKVQA